jgi:hypothetical protein
VVPVRKTKKNREKGSGAEEKFTPVVDIQDPIKEPELEPTATEGTSWPTEELHLKKKKKGLAVEEKGDPGQAEEKDVLKAKKDKKGESVEGGDEPISTPELQSAAAETSWGVLGTTSSKKGKKSKKQIALEEGEDPPLLGEKHKPDLEPVAIGESSWSMWGTTSKTGRTRRRGYRNYRHGISGEKCQSVVEPQPEPVEVYNFNTRGTSPVKKDKRNKKGGIVEDKTPAIIEEKRGSIVELESAANDDIGVSVWGIKSSKNERKGKMGAVEKRKYSPAPKEGNTETSASFEPETLAGEDNSWNAWRSSPPKKKGKKNTIFEERADSIAIDEPKADAPEDDWVAGGWLAKRRPRRKLLYKWSRTLLTLSRAISLSPARR